MLADFSSALAEFADDDAVRVVVLRGAGNERSHAGADISELGDQPIKVSGPTTTKGSACASCASSPSRSSP
jgi:enoyl-CoA hydratase/carnithine racemase